MDKVRIGIIGIGNMGSGHSLYLLPGEVSNAELNRHLRHRSRPHQVGARKPGREYSHIRQCR